ncbi:TrkH-domain-containing protein [Thelephora ganbajun]|uniref:TrkH-domain-containing protein n=1 Tax=Thelephora ganbajun TaxID=370292 RepID=A0ACB6Z4M5_THEGA|nr:TrkH-domain-containing protein [Thelephora ganbajun]
MVLAWLQAHLNFFRVHVLSFILIPLFWATIFWASNGKFYVKFIDALFLCISAATGTGLGSIDLSGLTAWQQAILVILEIIGSPVMVSWVVVMFRRHYFIKHLVDVVERNAKRRREIEAHNAGFRPVNADNQFTNSTGVMHRTKPPSTHVIRRVDEAPQPILSTDWNSIHANDQSCAEDSHPASGLSVTLSPDAAKGDHIIPHKPPPTQQHSAISEVSRRLLPKLHQKIERTVTMPRTATLLPADTVHTSQSPHESGTTVPYLSFPTIVGRNSVFHGLTEDQLEELGGIEFRALNMLMWAVPLYYFFSLAISFVVVAPYISASRWKDIFLVPTQHRNINPVWFALFQVVGAWANTGMSLVDQNMVLFQTAYAMIIFLIYCVLAGNTAFVRVPFFPSPTLLIRWAYSKVVWKSSKTYETARFLLDHPRRCFIYMFPSRQTWLLFVILLVINLTDWVCFLVFNIDNPIVEAVPTGTRVFIGLLQAISVRNAGFQVVPLAAVAPALKVLYVVMMYISIYPIAMSVRSTNVYEERSLGIFEDEGWRLGGDSRVAIWGNYLLQHSRTQLSFDMWFLALCLIVMCLIERSGLENPDNAFWFNIFSLIFEMVSAYGTVGLSLGIPNARASYLLYCFGNYSFAGALYTGSKVLLCIVMLRGRHRGLPMSLDRAIMLPHEFDKKEDILPIDGPDMGVVPVLRNTTKNTVECSQGSGGHAREATIEKI